MQGSAKGASLVICVLDAARADHVGCYGYPRPTTPNIDRLAQESLLFEQHFTQFTCTGPSTASLFTSQYPDTHLIQWRRPLPAATLTMARGLHDVGFHTALFSSNLNASPAGPYGLGMSLDETYCQAELQPLRTTEPRWTSPEVLLHAFERWLAEQKGSRFFAYLHFLPPHAPYYAPSEMIRVFEGQRPPGYEPGKYRPGEYDFPIKHKNPDLPPLPELINLYDANLRHGDWSIGQVVQLLAKAGLLEQTVLVVTADHGEAFGEHGFLGHGAPWGDGVTHVPLLIRLPRGMGGPKRINALTESIDLLPTLFELLGAPYPAERTQGHSLLPVMAGSTEKVRDYAFTRASEDGDKYMVQGQRYSVLLWGNGKWRALYDLTSDPEQKHNVIDQEPEQAARLIAAFRTFAAAQQRPPVKFVDPGAKAAPVVASSGKKLSAEAKKELRALGYLR